MVFIHHCEDSERFERAKEFLKTSKIIGLLMSNCTALEIIEISID